MDAAWARIIYDKIRHAGGNADRALTEVGLRFSDIKADDSRISMVSNNRLFIVASRLLGDQHLGLHLGASADPRNGGLLGYVGLSSRTIGDAIENLQRYVGVTSDQIEIDLVHGSDGLQLNIMSKNPVDPQDGPASEAGLAFVLNTYRQLARRNIRPVGVRFRHHRSKQSNGIFQRAFGCPVVFNADTFGITFKKADMAIPIATADERLLNILRGYCETLLEKRAINAPLFLVDVDRLIVEFLPGGRATSAVVANAMNMSARTFSRRLAKEGTAFKDRLANIRRNMAETYLEDRDLSVNQIAYLLGYSEPSAFNHAYRRWTGRSPSSNRRSVV